MKRKRDTDERIVFVVRQAEVGTPIGEVCRKTGTSEQTFYRWRTTLPGGDGRDPAAENARRRRDAGRDDVAGDPTPNVMRPSRRRSLVAWLRAECLKASWFLSMHDAGDRLESWRHDDNTARSHSALGNLTPNAFARQAREARKIA